MTAERICLLCGNDNRLAVKVGLVAWKDPQDGRHFDAIPRCTDAVSCRERCDAIDEPWLVRRVDDRTSIQVYDNAEKQPATREDRR